MKVFFLVIAPFLFSLSLWSQTNDIIVSAEKFQRNYLESSSSIYVLEEQDIENLNAGSLAELLKRKGGFSVQTNGAFGKASSINLRGTDNRHTLVVIDGVRVTDITSISGGTRLEFLDPNLIERIEILKGNQGVLYGSEAVGGVISITTKKTTKKGSRSQIAIDYGSYSQKKFSAHNSIKTGANTLSLSGSHQDIEGISAFNEKRIASNSMVEKDGLKQTDLLFHWNNTSFNKIILDAQVEYRNSSYLYDDATGDNQNLYGEYQTSRYSGTMSYLKTKWINIDFSYSRFQVDRKLFGENSFGKFNYIYRGSFDRYTLVNRSFYGNNGEWITGLEYEREKTKALDQLLDTTRSKERLGAYINNYNNFNGVIIEEGLRYEKLQFFGDKWV
jgi:vitamin B12 transporter